MIENALISRFAPSCREFIQEHAMIKPIASGEILFVEDGVSQSIIFPLDGIVSLQYPTQDNRFIEVIAMGREGVVAGQFGRECSRFPWRAITVVSGDAIWLPVAIFEECMGRFPCVRPAILECMSRVLRRLSQAVLCASLHPAGQRIATWLLHADDRTSGNKLDLTQRKISEILGLRLATVSDICSRLHASGAIDYTRGNIEVACRGTLESSACECYSATRLSSLGNISFFPG
jgi:CRP-like cAMP-binding protein